MKKLFPIKANVGDDGAPGVLAFAVEKEVGVIDITGPIGGDDAEVVRFADKVSDMLAAGVTTLRVRIMSPGGCVFTAMGFYDILRGAHEKGCQIRVEIIGLAASAATVVMLAGDSIAMSENARLMIHQPSTTIWGNVSELRISLKLLEDVWARMVELYTGRTGQTPEAFAAEHERDRYYTAQEALSAGLVDTIAPALGAPAEPESQPEPEPQPEPAAQSGSWLARMRGIAARLGLMPDAKQPEDFTLAQLRAAESKQVQLTAELTGLRAMLDEAIAERDAARMARDEAMADRAAEVEREVAARVAGMGLPSAVELPAGGIPAEGEPVADEPALESDEKVKSWLAHGTTGLLVRYACQSQAHRAQVLRLRKK